MNMSKNEAHGPRILVYGPQGAGKSTLLRYLINTTLNKCDDVYYLDTDPGQTEFSPPGVVSLTKVTGPLLGPSFSHLRTPYRMIFTGSINVASPPMHQKSVETLMQLFNVKFPQKTLFFNSENCSSFVKNILPNGVSHIQIPARKKNKAPFYTSKELRNFALLAYFGQCQKNFMPLTFMNAFPPVCVCWDNIAIYVMDKKVPPHRLIEAVHCSVVALCYVHQAFMLDSEQPELPRTLFDEPLNECIGFGLVRAADEVKHLLYIITPLSIQQLKKVNAIIKGNIMLPDDVFLKQPITNVPLPFTDQSEKIMRPSRQPVKELTIPTPNQSFYKLH
ncbi:polynucleotide 5'-hydroxyl-kinase nol-9 [Trichonephila clavata]|uniref:Polynucleotide 5'-hydroxyl-kinase nol-9 n=1 Tax=Trichonephila clavata TaxID=2740835 RepID=A0A8X6JEF8_TRICU|nr:polynucleotide 5'-hydroxyl-kinase nol-9 [Trichonephila clavata]